MKELTTTLVQRALAGERTAVRALVEMLTPIIQTRVARALVRRRHSAGGRDVRQEVEDLTQGVFIALFTDDGRALRQWDPSRGLALPGFVGLVADREVASTLRSRRQSPWTEDPTLDEELERAPDQRLGPEIEAMEHEMIEAVRAALRERLTDRGAEIFQLLVIEARSVDEVCARMNMTPNAVHAWSSRLSRLVREIVDEIASSDGRGRHDPT